MSIKLSNISENKAGEKRIIFINILTSLSIVCLYAKHPKQLIKVHIHNCSISLPIHEVPLGRHV